MRPLISVVIPVYKAERYLKRCIESIRNQSYVNLEIIMVDDGSPDSCPNICDEYIKVEKRCKVIHKENGGVSSARNAGIDIATGEYICFVDSDDSLPKQSIEFLYKAVADRKSQYAAGICSIENSEKVKNNIRETALINFAEKPLEVLEYICSPGSYSPYAKIYDLNIINKHGIRYDTTLKCSEDALMIRQYLKHCNCICLIPNVVYIYNMDNENSLSKKAYPDFSLYYAKKMQQLEELTDVLSLTKDQKKQFLTERAVHGMRISAHHYLSRWDDAEKQKNLLKIGTSVLSEWLFLAELDKYSESYKWWKKHVKNLSKNNFDLFFKSIKNEYDKEIRMREIKKFLKRFSKVRGFFC